MSDTNHYTGAITITPPVTAASKIRDAPGTQDARLRIIREVTPTDRGEVIVLTADAIEATCDGFSGYSLAEDIQRLADHIGPGHEFGGYIEVQWDAGYGEPPSRYVIRGGQVETLKPQLTWPGEAKPYAFTREELIGALRRRRKPRQPGTVLEGDAAFEAMADAIIAALDPDGGAGEFTGNQHVEFRDRTRCSEWQDGTFIKRDGDDALVTDDEGRTVRTPADRVRLPQRRTP